ncbi:hypothetical protein [Paractinoplanes hotanensis]|uniref:Uncharacterized protein n=1 Tax=Paractinoplanes hotanensis TaxID=2906497 RepID=A0ABT0YBT4_9ACTN|nr:hypothetical protein [Actinoplanes hotanensis]MCM4083526.1 hypothetical protein [Actinoplanes hotanensis]
MSLSAQRVEERGRADTRLLSTVREDHQRALLTVRTLGALVEASLWSEAWDLVARIDPHRLSHNLRERLRELVDRHDPAQPMSPPLRAMLPRLGRLG